MKDEVIKQHVTHGQSSLCLCVSTAPALPPSIVWPVSVGTCLRLLICPRLTPPVTFQPRPVSAAFLSLLLQAGLFSNVKKGVNTGQCSPVSLEWNTVAVNQGRRRQDQCCVCARRAPIFLVCACFRACFCLTGRLCASRTNVGGCFSPSPLPRRCCHRPPSPFLSGSCGLPGLPLPPSSRCRTAEGPGPRRWGRRSGEVGRVSCSPFLPFYRFMGAQSFSKYLPFPLYCGRLMAFDVRGWRCRGSGCQDAGRAGGRAGGRQERMDR